MELARLHLYMMVGLVKPYEGNIYLDDKEITKLTV